MKTYNTPELKFSIFDEEALISASNQSNNDVPENELDNGGSIIIIPDKDVFG